jgi:hypothetical protein
VLVYLVAKETTGSRGTNPKSTKVGFVHCSGYNKLFCRIKKGAVINQGRRKPLEGYLMINVDGAFDETKGPRGSAAVIRDTGGAFIAAAHSFIPHVLDAPSAEAETLRDGLLLAQQIGCNCVEIQSDCMK